MVRIYFVLMAISLLLTPIVKCDDDVIAIASNAVEDFGILESMTIGTSDQQPTPASSPRILIILLRRGKELIKMLPRLGIVIAHRILDHIPSPSQLLNFAKQVLVGLPQEVIAYAIDTVCKFTGKTQSNQMYRF